jgi:hypothetical protein
MSPPISSVPEQDRKARKREAKLRRDARRPPDSYERFKIMLDVLGEQRHVVDMEDHRARYSMIIMGAINAAMYLLATRVVHSGELAGGAEVWVVLVGLAYAAASVLFILAVIDCLRPRSLERKGLLHWEGALMHDLAEYETAWRDVRMDQLNREAVHIAHLLARMIEEKYQANRRLYRWLTVLIVLGAVVLGILGVFALRA